MVCFYEKKLLIVVVYIIYEYFIQNQTLIYKKKDQSISSLVKLCYYKELEHARGVDASDLAAKNFISLKTKVNKLDTAKLFNMPTSLNHLKTKMDDFVMLFILSYVVEEFSARKTKVNNLKKKIPDMTTLIHINQYNTGKPNLERKKKKKNGGVYKKDQTRVI